MNINSNNGKYDSLKRAQKADIDVGEHLTLQLTEGDRMLWESSPDGEHILTEHIPSSATIKTRWARRIQKKFQIPLAEALLFSYCMGVICNWDDDCRRYYEKQIQERNFEEVFREVRKLAFELIQLEPKDEILSFSPQLIEYHPISMADEEPDWDFLYQELTETDEMHPHLESYLNRRFGDIGTIVSQMARHPERRNILEKTYKKMEKNYDSFFKEHGIVEFPLTPTQAETVVAVLQEDWLKRQNKSDKRDEMIRDICKKIRRVGADKISDIGKKLYAWSKDNRRAKQHFGGHNIQMLWRTYKKRKADLEPFRLALLYRLK